MVYVKGYETKGSDGLLRQPLFSKPAFWRRRLSPLRHCFTFATPKEAYGLAGWLVPRVVIGGRVLNVIGHKERAVVKNNAVNFICIWINVTSVVGNKNSEQTDTEIWKQ